MDNKSGGKRQGETSADLRSKSAVERLVSNHFSSGDVVKIRRGDKNTERFWVIVKLAGEETCFGTVDSHLLLTDEHGLTYGDIFKFKRAEVVEIYRDC